MPIEHPSSAEQRSEFSGNLRFLHRHLLELRRSVRRRVSDGVSRRPRDVWAGKHRKRRTGEEQQSNIGTKGDIRRSFIIGNNKKSFLVAYKPYAGSSEASVRLTKVVAYLLLLVRISHNNQHFYILFGHREETRQREALSRPKNYTNLQFLPPINM